MPKCAKNTTDIRHRSHLSILERLTHDGAIFRAAILKNPLLLYAAADNAGAALREAGRILHSVYKRPPDVFFEDPPVVRGNLGQTVDLAIDSPEFDVLLDLVDHAIESG